MILNKLSDTEYEVILYDWAITHEEYIAGYIKRTPGTIGLKHDESNDTNYWMFYPCSKIPMNCGTLGKIENKLGAFNEELCG